MGNILDRLRDDDVGGESVDPSSTPHGHPRCLYPPRSGLYFGSHFIMGSEKFETGSPEAYLFGENMDLNFLGPKPVPFPYSTPLPDEPTRSLRALVNIRKETLRLIKFPTFTDTNDQNEIPAINSTISSTLNPSKTLSDVAEGSNVINGDSTKISSQIKVSRKRSVGKNLPDHHELKEIQSSSLSTAALPAATSSPKESSTSVQTKLHQETNHLLASSLSTTTNTQESAGPMYTIEFTFDSDVKCSITIYYLAVEESTPTGNIYVPRDPSYKTATYQYPMGAGQTFSQPGLIFNPNAFNEDDLEYRAFDEHGNFDPSVPFPVVIQINAEEGPEPRQCHSLIATVERNNEKQFYMKPFKQKIVIDGLAYIIQEIYGIENKNPVHLPGHGKSSFYSSDEEIEDNGSECVICMSESRDTLILPCRHLCLCNACADSLRYQANNCPICRSPFRALLHLRAIRKIPNSQTKTKTKEPQSTTEPQNTSSSTSSNANHRSNNSTSRPNDTKSETPSGYEAISLIESLNGPTLVKSSRPDDFGLYAFSSSFDDEDTVEVKTKTHSGSSKSMVHSKSARDFRRQLNESSSKNINRLPRSSHIKSSSSSLTDVRLQLSPNNQQSTGGNAIGDDQITQGHNHRKENDQLSNLIVSSMKI